LLEGEAPIAAKWRMNKMAAAAARWTTVMMTTMTLSTRCYLNANWQSNNTDSDFAAVTQKIFHQNLTRLSLSIPRMRRH
jgi:hypothetical protein